MRLQEGNFTLRAKQGLRRRAITTVFLINADVLLTCITILRQLCEIYIERRYTPILFLDLW